MIRSLFRCLASVLLSGAVVTVVLDAARSVAVSGFVFTSLKDFLSATGMVDVTALQSEIFLRYGADLWPIIDSGFLQPPIWFVFGVFALLLYILTYRSPRPFEILSH